MSENQSAVRFNFAQLVVLLILQVVLLGGAFLLGTRVGTSPEKKKVADAQIQDLKPDAAPSDNTLALAEPKADAPVKTPFDHAPTTVFRIKSSANSEYTLQIASYPDESAAIQVVDNWKKKGYMAFLSVEEIPDKGKWYRVNVGNFGEEKAAQDYAKTIQQKENINPQVIVTEQ